MSDLQSQLFGSAKFSERFGKILREDEEIRNEYELHLRLMWEYFATYKRQRGEDVSLDEFLERKDLQEEAFDIWNEHGLQLAFQGLANDQRPPLPEEKSGKMRPADGEVAEDDKADFLPSITLDDVLKRRAEIQA
ncbi:MAG: hypothetical protein WDZ79_01110 [Candidatus Paceibacterota bacterium]